MRYEDDHSQDQQEIWGCSPPAMLFGGLVILILGIPDWGAGHRAGGTVGAAIFGTAFVLIAIYRFIRNAIRNHRNRKF